MQRILAVFLTCKCNVYMGRAVFYKWHVRVCNVINGRAVFNMSDDGRHTFQQNPHEGSPHELLQKSQSTRMQRRRRRVPRGA